ncbi:MAG: L,D-transpeptidase family protein, partial [Pseudolabrys sp.]
FRLVRLWWRADRHPRPVTALPVRRIRPDDGWCEDPADRRYNRPVKVRPKSMADRLTRADHLYDFIIELDHNTRPRVAGRGSAVFIHAARPGFAPTAGCVALELKDLRRLLARLGPRTHIVIEN